MGNFRTLIAWQKAHQLVLDVYRTASGFPADERFGLTRQLRRSVTAIPADIAEGSGRDTDPELRHFFVMARGSAWETEYHLLLARDLGYLSAADYGRLDSDAREVGRLLQGLIKRYSRSPGATRKGSREGRRRRSHETSKPAEVITAGPK